MIYCPVENLNLAVLAHVTETELLNFGLILAIPPLLTQRALARFISVTVVAQPASSIKSADVNIIVFMTVYCPFG